MKTLLLSFSFIFYWSSFYPVTSGQTYADLLQWTRDSQCVTEAGDILTSLEFVLVELHRIRYETKLTRHVVSSTREMVLHLNSTVSELNKLVRKMNSTQSAINSRLECSNNGNGFRTDEETSLNSPDVLNTTEQEFDTRIDTVEPMSQPGGQAPEAPVFQEDWDLSVDSEEQDEKQDDGEDDLDNHVTTFPSTARAERVTNSLDMRSQTRRYLDSVSLPLESDNNKIVDYVDEDGLFSSETVGPNSESSFQRGDTTLTQTVVSSPPSLSDLTSIGADRLPRDCNDVAREHSASGIYVISPGNEIGLSFSVFCQIEDENTWTVFQRRESGKVNFFRTWSDYKDGFGDLWGEFWLGNENLHMLTSSGEYALRIDMWDWDNDEPEAIGMYFYAESDFFRIENESSAYRLRVPRDFYSYKGYGGSGLRLHAGKFMTFDRQFPDVSGAQNCAQIFHCGWWFSTCVRNANLNGKYYFQGYENNAKKERAIDDIYWRNIPRSLRKVEMKLKRNI